MTHFKLAKEIERAREIYGPKSEGRLMNTSHIHDNKVDVRPYGSRSPEGSDRDRSTEKTTKYRKIPTD